MSAKQPQGQGGIGDAIQGDGTRQAASAFDDLLDRLMALAVPVESPTAGSTWVERRVSDFDMKSAFGPRE